MTLRVRSTAIEHDQWPLWRGTYVCVGSCERIPTNIRSEASDDTPSEDSDQSGNDFSLSSSSSSLDLLSTPKNRSKTPHQAGKQHRCQAKLLVRNILHGVAPYH